MLGRDLESALGSICECDVDNLGVIKEQLRDAQASGSAHPSMLLKYFGFLSKFREVTFIARFFITLWSVANVSILRPQVLLLFFDLSQVSSPIPLNLHFL